MSIELQQIAVLLAVALVMLLMNLKAGYVWMAVATFAAMVASLGGAVWLVLEWVFLS